MCVCVCVYKWTVSNPQTRQQIVYVCVLKHFHINTNELDNHYIDKCAVCMCRTETDNLNNKMFMYKCEQGQVDSGMQFVTNRNCKQQFCVCVCTLYQRTKN